MLNRAAGNPVALVYARGGAYGPGTGGEASDTQSNDLQGVFGFSGFSEVKSILVEPTMAGPEAKEQAAAVAMKQADRLARNF